MGSIESAIRNMDSYTREELSRLCRAYENNKSARILEEIKAIITNFSDDDPEEFVKVLRR